MDTKNERQIIDKEINRLKALRTNRKDALQQLTGEECAGAFQALPDRALENVTGGKDNPYDNFITGVYVCPKCGGAHGVRLYNINICFKPFWSSGCIDFSTGLFDADFPTPNSLVGEIISTVDGTRYTFVAVSHTENGETRWLI